MRTLIRYGLFSAIAAALTVGTAAQAPFRPSSSTSPDLTTTLSVTGCLALRSALPTAVTPAAVATTSAAPDSTIVLADAHEDISDSASTPSAVAIGSIAHAYLLYGHVVYIDGRTLEEEIGHTAEIVGVADLRQDGPHGPRTFRLTVLRVKTIGPKCSPSTARR